MADLKRPIALMVLIGFASPAKAEPMATWEGPIAEASARFGIPAAWIRNVIRTESGGNTRLGGRLIRSRVGAMGLMQLMPRTWLQMRQAHGLGSDPDDPRDNILAGTAYLRAMHDRFGYPGLFAAYNAGPGRYADHLARGTPLPGETVAYLAKVSGRESRVPPWPALPPAAPRLRETDSVFAIRGTVPVASAASAVAHAAASSTLFYTRSWPSR